MADDKIRISWDEVQSTSVDEKTKRQAAMTRAAQQFTNAPMPPLPQTATHATTQSWLYNSLIYMAFFGGIGGIFGWIGGEVVELLRPNRWEEFQTVVLVEDVILTLQRNGEISHDEAQKRLDRLYEEHRANPFLAIALNRSLSKTERDRQFKDRMDKSATQVAIQQFMFFSIIAMPLAFWLSIGDSVLSRNWTGVMICGSVALALGLFGGGLVSLFINKLYNTLGGGKADSNYAFQMIARSIGWGVLGGFLTIAPGVVLRNIKRLGIGLAGGLIGGLVGGALFDPLGLLTHSDIVSRFVAIVAIGVLAGVGTGLIENAAKSGWLKVVAGLITGKQFVLYRNPTVIGSSPQCEIYLFKDPQVGPRHAALHLLGRGFEIESLHPGGATFVNGQPISRARLRNGDQVQIGSTAFVFQEKERSQLG